MRIRRIAILFATASLLATWQANPSMAQDEVREDLVWQEVQRDFRELSKATGQRLQDANATLEDAIEKVRQELEALESTGAKLRLKLGDQHPAAKKTAEGIEQLSSRLALLEEKRAAILMNQRLEKSRAELRSALKTVSSVEHSELQTAQAFIGELKTELARAEKMLAEKLEAEIRFDPAAEYRTVWEGQLAELEKKELELGKKMEADQVARLAMEERMKAAEAVFAEKRRAIEKARQTVEYREQTAEAETMKRSESTDKRLDAMENRLERIEAMLEKLVNHLSTAEKDKQ